MHPVTNLASSSIQLKPGATWYKLEAANKDRFFSEAVKDSNAGPYWEMQVNGYLGGNTKNHILTSALLSLDEFVVMFLDKDGNVRFIGNEDAAASCRINYTSGDTDSSRKRTVTFFWEHASVSPIYIGSLENIQDDVITPPFAELRDFSDDFSNDFN